MVTLGPVYLLIIFFHLAYNKAKLAFFFFSGRITHLWYLGDHIIFHLYILSNKESLFYTIVIVTQFEYLLHIFNWRALLPVQIEMIRSFSPDGFNLKGKWAQT